MNTDEHINDVDQRNKDIQKVIQKVIDLWADICEMIQTFVDALVKAIAPFADYLFDHPAFVEIQRNDAVLHGGAGRGIRRRPDWV